MTRRLSGPEQIVRLAEVWGAHMRFSESTVSQRLMRASGWLRHLREGADMTTGTYLKAKTWFRENWPADLPWPEGVHRGEELPDEPVAKPKRGRAA